MCITFTYEYYGPVIFLGKRATPSRLGIRFLSLDEHRKVMLYTSKIIGLDAILAHVDTETTVLIPSGVFLFVATFHRYFLSFIHISFAQGLFLYF